MASPLPVYPYTTFNLKASLKGLYGGLSGTDCFLPGLLSMDLRDLDASREYGYEQRYANDLAKMYIGEFRLKCPSVMRDESSPNVTWREGGPMTLTEKNNRVRQASSAPICAPGLRSRARTRKKWRWNVV